MHIDTSIVVLEHTAADRQTRRGRIDGIRSAAQELCSSDGASSPVVVQCPTVVGQHRVSHIQPRRVDIQRGIAPIANDRMSQVATRGRAVEGEATSAPISHSRSSSITIVVGVSANRIVLDRGQYHGLRSRTFGLQTAVHHNIHITSRELDHGTGVNHQAAIAGHRHVPLENPGQVSHPGGGPGDAAAHAHTVVPVVLGGVPAEGRLAVGRHFHSVGSVSPEGVALDGGYRGALHVEAAARVLEKRVARDQRVGLVVQVQPVPLTVGDGAIGDVRRGAVQRDALVVVVPAAAHQDVVQHAAAVV